eukprot:3916759-Ditylum_brightwellii.AAC.2
MSDSASGDGLSRVAAAEDANYCSDDTIEDNVDTNDLESEFSDSEDQEEEWKTKRCWHQPRRKATKCQLTRTSMHGMITQNTQSLGVSR